MNQVTSKEINKFTTMHGKSTITFTDKIFNNTDINWLSRLNWSFQRMMRKQEKKNFD